MNYHVCPQNKSFFFPCSIIHLYCDIECLYFRDLCIFDFFLIFPFTHVLWFKVEELDKANETGQYGPLLCSTKTARQPAILHNAEDNH